MFIGRHKCQIHTHLNFKVIRTCVVCFHFIIHGYSNITSKWPLKKECLENATYIHLHHGIYPLLIFLSSNDRHHMQLHKYTHTFMDDALAFHVE